MKRVLAVLIQYFLQLLQLVVVAEVEIVQIQHSHFIWVVKLVAQVVVAVLTLITQQHLLLVREQHLQYKVMMVVQVGTRLVQAVEVAVLVRLVLIL
jgi:hypothetical protein